VGHSVHVDDPELWAYVPTGQSRHKDPSVGEYVPAGQDGHKNEPADDENPFGHFVHTELETDSVYVPAKHFWHADPPTG
jgi:hypothetical protein